MKTKLFAALIVLFLYTVFIIGFSIADDQGQIDNLFGAVGLADQSYAQTTHGLETSQPGFAMVSQGNLIDPIPDPNRPPKPGLIDPIPDPNRPPKPALIDPIPDPNRPPKPALIDPIPDPNRPPKP